MPRTSRASRGGYVYHVLNRGNGWSDIFHQEEDFAAFVGLMREANDKVPMRVTGYCLMANHFHLLVWPKKDGDLSRWMQWLLTAHVRRYHRQYQGSGHVWQGRFKAFPVQGDNHYLTALRYIEANPLRANLVQRSQDWEWSSLKPTSAADPAGLLSDGPVPKPTQWTRLVNAAQNEAELKALRHSLDRGTPFGAPAWQMKAAKILGLESSLRPRGRPKKEK